MKATLEAEIKKRKMSLLGHREALHKAAGFHLPPGAACARENSLSQKAGPRQEGAAAPAPLGRRGPLPSAVWRREWVLPVACGAVPVADKGENVGPARQSALTPLERLGLVVSCGLPAPLRDAGKDHSLAPCGSDGLGFGQRDGASLQVGARKAQAVEAEGLALAVSAAVLPAPELDRNAVAAGEVPLALA